jgi:DNA-binding NtrC family response regulator
VLIVGERGSGRERLARALHSLSKRAQHPFVRLDCAELVEKWGDDAPRMREEIQSAVRGARSGTLYLREVQELSIVGQAALLDFLPPVSTDTSGNDIRLIASTDCDLRALVAGGHFRSDLALILHVVTLHLPALRERRADIVPLTEQLIAQRANGHERRISPELKRYLEGRVWYGNVKELDEAISEALSHSSSGPLSVEDFGQTETSDLDVPPTIPGASLSDIERYAILKTLQAQGGSTSRAARILGISVRKIQYKLHEYGFSRLRSSSDSDAG